MAMKVLIDNGHGIETLGKRSPDGRRPDGKSVRLRCKLIAAAPHTHLAAAFKKF